MYFNIVSFSEKRTLKQLIKDIGSKLYDSNDDFTCVLVNMQYENNTTEKAYIVYKGLQVITYDTIQGKEFNFKFNDTKISGKLKILKRYVINKNGKVNTADAKTKQIDLVDLKDIRTTGKYNVYIKK